VNDSVVYVPIIGKSTPQGVMEIYGLQSSESSPGGNFQRSDKVLRAMINAKDYK